MVRIDDANSSFISVPINTLRVDSVTDFDVYIRMQKGQQPVLYRQRKLVFTREALERLHNNQVTQVFIEAAQETAYRRYVEENLGDFLADETRSIEDKSELLYDSAQGLIKDVMADPRAGDTVPRSKKLVENTCKFLFENKNAFHSLLNVVSFDYYTYTHSINVFVFSVSLAQRVLPDVSLLHEFGVGALLHDIGKSQIGADIINCSGKLSKEQWDTMRQHPVHGYEMLREHGNVGELGLDIVMHHHEKLGSGKGYPDGLKGDQISLYARIVTIADIFDALTTQRAYKNAMETFPALRLMKEEIADDLDPEYFAAFVRLMSGSS